MSYLTTLASVTSTMNDKFGTSVSIWAEDEDNIYAAGRSLTTSFSGVWDPILIKYNFVNEKLSEINIGEYETVRVGEVVNDNLILLLTNYSCLSLLLLKTYLNNEL